MTKATPASDQGRGTWPSRASPATRAMAGSRHIKVPKAEVVSRRRANISRLNGMTGSSKANPKPTRSRCGVRSAEDGRPGHQSRRQGRNRDGHGQALQACHLVPDRLGEHDVGGPAERRAQRGGDAHQIETALPRVGQQQHAGRGEAWPEQRAAAAGAGDGHAERAEELKGAGRAEWQAGHGRHEQHGHPGGREAEGDRGQQHRRRKRQGRGRTAVSRITAAQASRSQAAPSGPTSPKRWTDSAKPSWTQLIEPSAIKVPERAEVRGAAVMLTMTASTRHRDRPCPREFDGHTIHQS